MQAAYDPEPAAELLERAWRTGTQITELPGRLRPRTLDEGYLVQERLLHRIGEPVAGWKLGVGSPNARRRAGIARALVGRVLKSQCVRAPATVAVPNRAPLLIEIEVGLVLGRDVAPDADIPHLAEIVGAVHLTSELVLSRFVDFTAVGWPSFVADNAACQALVIGPAIAFDDIDRCLETITARVGGRQVQALERDDRADPCQALRDLLSFCRDQHITLESGTIVSTGSVLQPFLTDGSDVQVTAGFGPATFTFETRLGGAGVWTG